MKRNRLKLLQRSALIVVALLAAGAIVGTVATAQPVILERFVTVPADDVTATAILGGVLPLVRELPPGVTRGVIFVDPPGRPIGSRYVHVPYESGDRPVGRLDMRIGELGPGNGTWVDIQGARMLVTINDTSEGYRTVNYGWEARGIAYRLGVKLVGSITRESADRMAASVR